jgi:inner membrane protein
MDNITHSLTGALTAKFIESRPTQPEEKNIYRRTFFWLFVLAANFPDIDVLVGLTGDPVLSIRHHRGITHSILFAPVLAIAPALLFRFFSKVDNIRLLWIISLLGILIHIFFDLVTAFGTRILLPLSETRYALDWFFIIDPFFTLLLAGVLLAGKWLPRRRSLTTSIGIAVAVLYVLATAFNHGMAEIRVKEAARKEGVMWTRISTLPQPLSIFRWQGLVQTDGAVLQTFFSLFDDGTPAFKRYEQDSDAYVERAMKESHMSWYLPFARHPWIRSFEENGHHVVEYRDLMFSIDESLVRAVGFTERFTPFSLRYSYSSDGKLVGVEFDGEPLDPE